MNEVSLRVNGVDYAGWLDVEITAGIERQARDFSLNITRTWPGAKDIPRKVQPGDICEVYIDADKVLTGYIDATPIRYDGNSISVSVKGRSKTADLVDCAADVGSGQWRGRKIESIATELAEVYGIKVVCDVNTGEVIADHQIDTGETAFECIARLLVLRQLLSTDDADGNLHLINAGSGGNAETMLKLGENVLSASAGLDYKDVFGLYVVKGQRAGSDDETAQTVASVSASASDTTIKRNRRTILQLNGNATKLDCQQRAKYERLYRAAKALETVYTVQGWRQANGQLWVPNKIVRVVDDVIGFDSELLITEVSYNKGANGTTCALTVSPKEGYIPSPEVTAKEKSKKSGASTDQWKDIKAAK